METYSCPNEPIALPEITVKNQLTSQSNLEGFCVLPAKCDRCITAARGCSLSVFVCFKCEQYLCTKCSDVHLEGFPNHHMLGKIDDDHTWWKKFQYMYEDFASENLDTEIENVKVRISDRIGIKHDKDTQECRVTGLCVLSDGRLVITDRKNTSIKVVNTTTHVIEHYVTFSSYPWDVTPVCDENSGDLKQLIENKAATNGIVKRDLPDNEYESILFSSTFTEEKQIVLFQIHEEVLEVINVIHLESKCHAISYSIGKYFVTCSEPNSVLVVTITGEVLQYVEYDNLEKPLFQGTPEHITAHPKEHSIYVTSYYDETIVKIDFHDSSKITKTFIPKSKGITTDSDGNLYVCSWKKVYKVKDNTSNILCILDNNELFIEAPRPIVFSKNRLYLGHSSSPSLHSTITVAEIV